MKYTAIISTDEPITEDIIQALKDTMFFGDDPAYAFEIEDIKLEQEPFINKPCMSSGVCEHDKQKVLDKIRAEIEQITDTMGVSYNQYVSKIDVLQIIDKYKAEGSKEA